jgi:hypothetical protein
MGKCCHKKLPVNRAWQGCRYEMPSPATKNTLQLNCFGTKMRCIHLSINQVARPVAVVITGGKGLYNPNGF